MTMKSPYQGHTDTFCEDCESCKLLKANKDFLDTLLNSSLSIPHLAGCVIIGFTEHLEDASLGGISSSVAISKRHSKETQEKVKKAIREIMQLLAGEKSNDL